MTEYMEVDLKEYAWKPYPSKSFDQQKAFEISRDELFNMSIEKKNNINKLRADYVDSLIKHRGENKSNYDFLKSIEGTVEEGLKPEIADILAAHKQKEYNVNSLSQNEAFRSQSYAD